MLWAWQLQASSAADFLQGKWLEQVRFSAEDKIIVKCQQGQLIITKNGTRANSEE